MLLKELELHLNLWRQGTKALVCADTKYSWVSFLIMSVNSPTCSEARFYMWSNLRRPSMIMVSGLFLQTFRFLDRIWTALPSPLWVGCLYNFLSFGYLVCVYPKFSWVDSLLIPATSPTSFEARFCIWCLCGYRLGQPYVVPSSFDILKWHRVQRLF